MDAHGFWDGRIHRYIEGGGRGVMDGGEAE
jgi:hypothetical protein